MKKKNIFFVLLICFINSSCNKEEQTDELQDKDFYSDVTTRASYISGTITGEMNPYVGDGYYTYDLSIPIQKQSVGIRISAVGVLVADVVSVANTQFFGVIILGDAITGRCGEGCYTGTAVGVASERKYRVKNFGQALVAYGQNLSYRVIFVCIQYGCIVLVFRGCCQRFSIKEKETVECVL